MDQQKIGKFLKELRNQNGLTQEEFAEIVYVSSRTISRWENGKNMPDLDVLIGIADYYDVDLLEILNGERKSEKMNEEMEETVLKSVDYTNTEAEHFRKRIHWLLSVGAVLWLISQIINHTTLVEVTAVRNLSEFIDGAATGMIILGIIVSSRYGNRMKEFKQRLLKRS